MRSRLRAVSPGRTDRLGELLEAVEAASAGLSSGEVLEAIGGAGRLKAVLRAHYAALMAPAPASPPAEPAVRYLAG